MCIRDRYSEKLLKKPQIVAANKIDLIGEDSEEYKDFKAYVEEQGYEVFPMSAPINQGVQEVLAAAANKLQQVLAEPQEEDDYELFDFEKDENDPDYRTVTVSYDGNSFVLHGKQLLKIFNSTNFTDFGSLRYLYKYIEKSGAIDQMKEMGIEDGDIIKIEDFEFEYYDCLLYTSSDRCDPEAFHRCCNRPDQGQYPVADRFCCFLSS